MKETKITFRIDKELKIKFEIYCATNQVTQTETLVTFIEDLVSRSPVESEKEET